MTTTETPILALGRRISDAWRRNQFFDMGGEGRQLVGRDQAYRLMDAAITERTALVGAVCGLPAETIADAVIQLLAAYELADAMDGAFEGERRPGPGTTGDRKRAQGRLLATRRGRSGGSGPSS